MVTFDAFISADTSSEIARVSARDHISPEESAAKEKANHECAIHCRLVSEEDEILKNFSCGQPNFTLSLTYICFFSKLSQLLKCICWP